MFNTPLCLHFTMSGESGSSAISLNFDLPNIISFFLLGAVNGLVTGGVLGTSATGGVSPYAGGGTLILASVAGIVGLFATSLVATLFSNYSKNTRLNLISKGEKGWSLSKGGHILLGGIFNGLFFWLLHSLAFFQGAGFFGNALAGALALMGYSVVIMPVMSALKGVM